MKEFDLPPDGAEELRALLERSGAAFQREGNRFRLRFASRGCRWQTVCDCRGSLVLVYGIHPARLTERFEARERIAAALEYNAAVLSSQWERIAAGAQGLVLPRNPNTAGPA